MHCLVEYNILRYSIISIYIHYTYNISLWHLKFSTKKVSFSNWLTIFTTKKCSVQSNKKLRLKVSIKNVLLLLLLIDLGQIKPSSLEKYGEKTEKCLAEYGVDMPTMGDVLWNLEYAKRINFSF